MRPFLKRRLSGQAAMELAVFGAVVIFVIGMILRVSLRTSQAVNKDLRVFRMALAESFVTGRGQYASGDNSSARNAASILLIEDRLGIDSAQPVTRDRWPYFAQGSGTMSTNILMEFKPTIASDITVMDIFINGQRFPLTIGRYVEIDLASLRDQPLSNPKGIAPCNGQNYGPGRGACYFTEIDISGQTIYRYRFFKKIYNGVDKEWCHGSGCSPSADIRFDFNFDGTPDVLAGEALPWGFFTESVRVHYGWQWYPVEEVELEEGLMVDITGNLAEEAIYKMHRAPPPEIIANREELWDWTEPPPGELITIQAMDFTAGDIDVGAGNAGAKARWAEYRSRTSPDPGPFRSPGLQPDMRMYSDTRYGILENREGRLFDGGGRFVRNAARQDQVDIIERKLYLSSNTGRYCSGSSPQQWGGSAFAAAQGLLGLTNPVEVCVGQSSQCFSGGNIGRTCMAVNDPGGPTIYVRSRLRDTRETIWSTRTGD